MAKLLFVYGTLMQGMRNASYMEGAKFVGAAQTKPEYELLFNGSIPAARKGAESIKGELYEVEDAMLATLDELEEVSSKLYDRADAEVDGKKAIIYLGGERLFGSDSWTKVPEGDFHKVAPSK